MSGHEEDYLWVRVRELLNNLGIVGPNIPHRVDEDPGPDLPGEEGAEWCVCGRIWPCEAWQLDGLIGEAESEALASPEPAPHAWCESCGYAHPVNDPDCIDAST